MTAASDSIMDHSLYLSTDFESRHTSGAVLSMAYFRFYGQGIEDDLRLFSLFCRGRVLSLTQIHTLQHNQELLLC